MKNAQKTVTLRVTEHNYERLAKVADIIGQTPEELLNGEVIGTALRDPESVLDADLMGGFRKPTIKERAQWDGLLAMHDDGWEPETIEASDNDSEGSNMATVAIWKSQFKQMERAAEIVRRIGGDEDDTAGHLLRTFWITDDGPGELADLFVDSVSKPDSEKQAMKDRLNALRKSEPALFEV